MLEKHRKITLERIEKFVEKLHSKRYAKTTAVTVTHWAAPDRIPFTEIQKDSFSEISIGSPLGPLWATHWLHVSIDSTHESWIDMGDIYFILDFGGEALIWTENGIPLHSLNGQTGEDRRENFRLYPSPYYNELKNGFYIECACNELFGNSDWKVGPTAPSDSKSYSLKQIEIGLILPSFWKLYHDYIVIADVAKYQDENSWEAAEALRVANEMINSIDLDDTSTFSKACKISEEYFKSDRGKHSGFQITAIGHCHIDTAWLWPYAETKRKCARSWSSQLRLMEKYPQYKFACSQAQQYEWVKENYPDLFSKIKDAVSNGSFIPVGGTWVEMDCNIPSGESLVRQFLYGQRFFKEHFDVETSPIFWLPDTFGYAAQMPQIIKLAGMKYFLTQKLCWNQINKFPHNTFVWEGIDGSRVVTHFPPADNYCSHARIGDILKSEHNFKDKERSSEGLLVYGHGDGGGGPNAKMIEMLTRVQENSFGSIPSLNFGSPVDFFERLEKRKDEYCVWSGELYFEYHRGTYTTQAKNKLYNRRSEDLMRELELLLVLCNNNKSINDCISFKNSFTKWWKLILLNQFHDVIPGTSIHCVYEDSNSHYESIFNESTIVKNDLLKKLQKTGNDESYLIVNPLGFNRRELVEVPKSFIKNSNGSNQDINDSTVLALVDIPSAGYTMNTNFLVTENTVSLTNNNNGFNIKNKWINVDIDITGQITSLIWISTGKQIIEQGKRGNHFIMFDDNPLFWDAWDVDVYHLEKRFEFHNEAQITNEIIENGPLRVSIQFTIPISKESSIIQTIRITSESQLIEFDNIVDWNESHKFLKVEFPTTIRSQQCTYEIPYGWVQRPTHYNTSWDLARFEVCGHRFADLAEYNFGVSLLNDCKYGYSTKDSKMTLSLLRSPKAPDETADMGKHEFKFAFYPHENSFQDAKVVQTGLRFNNPVVLHSISNSLNDSISFSFAHVDCSAIIIDQIKLAEDSNDIIIRMYESYGGSHTKCTIQLGASPSKVSIVNLLEEEIESNNDISIINSNSFILSFKPFEIITVKITMDE